MPRSKTTSETPTLSPTEDTSSSEEVVEQKSSIEDIIKWLQINIDGQKKVISNLKSINKEHQKALANAEKASKKKKRISSAATVPMVLSDELCKFLETDKDVFMTKSEVTKRITSYIKEKGLQKKDEPKIIQPDKKLKDLLKYPDDVVWNFLNLQKYIRLHLSAVPK